MTAIQLAQCPHGLTRDPSAPLRPARERVRCAALPETCAIVVVIMIVLLLPLPLGSFHAAGWMVFSLLCGLTAICYSATRRHLPAYRPTASRAITITLASMGLLAAAQWIGARFGSTTLAGGPDAAIAAVRLFGLALFSMLCGEVVASSANPYRVARRIVFMVFFGVVAYASVSLATGQTDVAPRAGLHGPFGNRNAYAMYLGMGALAGIALLLMPEGQFQTRTVQTLRLTSLWLGLGAIIAALVATQSRLGITSFAIGAVVLAFLTISRRNVRQAVGFVAVLAVAAAIFGEPAAGRVAALADDWTVREHLYRQIAAMIAERPIFGHGADGFALAFEQYHAPPVSIDFVWDRSHSTYLKLWSELGLAIGSLPVLAAVLVLLRCRQMVSSPAYRFAPLGIGLLTQVGLHALFDFGIEVLANQAMLVLLLGFATIPTAVRQSQKS